MLLASTAQAADAWRLDDALHTPEWLTVGGSYYARYESLGDSFKAGSASDQILIHRTLLNAEADLNGIDLGLEVIDSRQTLADSGSSLGTSTVNTFDVSEAYGAFDFGSRMGAGSNVVLTVGRRTLDLGSRRLVARPKYRSTMNSFDGADIVWQSGSGTTVQAFYFHPVNIEPSGKADLLDNEHEWDASTSNARLYGVFTTLAQPGDGKVELYVIGFDEDDSDYRPTANRKLYTPGARWMTTPAAGRWDYEVEFMYQLGQLRSSKSASNVADLDQRAWSAHMGAGYTFQGTWKPRLVVEWDYASGDEDSADGENNRFDKLYGVARGDFGPTSAYGAFGRANINSPGYHLTFTPSQPLNVMVSQRLIWLASDTDSWSGYRDVTGGSGSYVGHQIETRVRYKASGNLDLECGGAYLMAGEFMEEAPGSPDRGNAAYGYVQATVKF